jgi:N-hydroxyarylamine O-acetyltransferase
LNLGAYFERIGYTEPAVASVACLRALHRLHPMAIPFENLNTLARLPVPLDVESLATKMITSARGGYCFEQNRLFAAALEQIGFTVTPLAGRVLWGQTQAYANPRTHMVLLVECEGAAFISDVGFGGCTPTAPIELIVGREQDTPHETFRLADDGGNFELQVCLAGQWRPMYRFDLQRQQPVDYEMANHYVATHPNSHFRSVLTAARAFEGGRHALRNNVLTTYSVTGSAVERRVENAAELKRVLEEIFGIRMPLSAEFDSALERLSAPTVQAK